MINQNSWVSGWAKENVKHLHWLLLFSLGSYLLAISVYLFTAQDLGHFFTVKTFINHALYFFIPWSIINVIFFAQLWFGRDTDSRSRRMFIKIMATFFGAVLASIVADWAYLYYDIVENNHIVFGSLEFTSRESNYIEQVFVSLLIGVPIFMRQNKRLTLLSELKEKDEEVEKLTELKLLSDLDALQAKINPHFLYNSLNSLLSLIREKPDEAEQMVINLSNLFRYSLPTQSQHTTTIEEEMKVVQTYLDIERVRFTDKLNVDLNVEPELNEVRIPRFFLQPLVENAVKHGTSKITTGKIKLEIRRKDNGLEIDLYDNGPDFPIAIKDGYGLKSTFEKLNILYPNQHDISFHNAPSKHIHIELYQLNTTITDV